MVRNEAFVGDSEEHSEPEENDETSVVGIGEFDSSLKSDTAQRIVQDWIEVGHRGIIVSYFKFCRCLMCLLSVRHYSSLEFFLLVQEATESLFPSSNFLESLKDGVLLCK